VPNPPLQEVGGICEKKFTRKSCSMQNEAGFARKILPTNPAPCKMKRDSQEKLYPQIPLYGSVELRKKGVSRF
jgi:hypothetical protein